MRATFTDLQEQLVDAGAMIEDELAETLHLGLVVRTMYWNQGDQDGVLDGLPLLDG